MSANPDYAKLVSQAEKAVSGVTDPELKRVAFQKVLDDLLVLAASDRHGTKAASPRRKAGTKVPDSKARRGPQGYITELIGDGFFAKPKTIAQVKAELENRGHHIPITSLSGPLQALCQKRALRRQKSKISDGKQTYAYSEW
jgi:hypothetical protein